MALFFDYYITLVSDWSIARSHYNPPPPKIDVTPDGGRDGGGVLHFRWKASRRSMTTDFTSALTPRGLVFCNDFWMPA